MTDKLDELAQRFRLGADSATRGKARAKAQEDPDYEAAVDYARRMNAMGASITIARSLEILKERKSNDANNA